MCSASCTSRRKTFPSALALITREDWTSFHKLPKPLGTAKNVRGRLRKKWTEGVLRGGHAESTVISFNRSLSGSDFPASRGLFFPLVFGGREEKRKRVYFPLLRRLPGKEIFASKQALAASSCGTLNKNNIPLFWGYSMSVVYYECARTWTSSKPYKL